MGKCILSHMQSLRQIFANVCSEQNTSVPLAWPKKMADLAAFCLQGIGAITNQRSSSFLITGSFLGGMGGLQEPSDTVHATASGASSPRTFLSLERLFAAHTPAGIGTTWPLSKVHSGSVELTVTLLRQGSSPSRTTF